MAKMSRVHKIFGPPGTGKTTRLLRLVEEAMAAGVKPERIAFMSFTKKAADEAVERAVEKFQMAKDRFPHFRTLHSMAFAHLHARRDDIMQEEHFQELGRTLGFRFTKLTTIDGDWNWMPMGTALGDKVEKIQALSRVRQVSLSDQWYDSNLREVHWLAVGQWAEGLKRYKDSRGLMDYTDLLEQYDGNLDVDLFIIDEAQDLSPLQWRVVRNASRNAKQIFLAGDDDQCIYGWAGADVNRFLNISKSNCTVEVLPKSFRLPAAIHFLAESIASGIQVRQAKNWTSRNERGRIDRIASERLLDLSTGTWMLLARNHAFLPRFEEVCHNQGYSYTRDGNHSTNNSSTKAIQLWEHWRKGGALKPSEFKLIATHIPMLGDFQPKEDILLKDTVARSLKPLTWMDVLEITPRKREYYRACLANRESFNADPRITISTIHRVKGGEADHVVLIPDLTPNPYDELNTDDEQRVLYVAVTRAKKSLTIIQPQAQRHYRI
jgi:DNA helicase-2/ATP-dependent DNA helicase PcrA